MKTRMEWKPINSVGAEFEKVQLSADGIDVVTSTNQSEILPLITHSLGYDIAPSQSLDLIRSHGLSSHSLIETNLDQNQLIVTDSNHSLSTLDHEVDPSIFNIGPVIGPNIDNNSIVPSPEPFPDLVLHADFGDQTAPPQAVSIPLGFNWFFNKGMWTLVPSAFLKNMDSQPSSEAEFDSPKPDLEPGPLPVSPPEHPLSPDYEALPSADS